MATINTGPAAVDTGATTTTIGPLDRAPATVQSLYATYAARFGY